jgi:hypothetical protein
MQDFHGETFVAFVDISGFKVFMNDKDKAYKALDKFYNIGYDSLKSNSYQNDINGIDGIDGFFISDCGILFPRFHGEEHNKLDFQPYQSALSNLLNIIEQISKEMISSRDDRDNFMLKVSIAYGEFKYYERTVSPIIDKTFFLGNAYLNAFLDNESKKHKLDPGQCRILIKNQQNVNDQEDLNDFWKHIQDSDEKPFDKITEKPKDTKHLYFYWMVSDKHEIDNFNKKYNDTKNLKNKYEGMIDVLKQFTNQNDLNSRYVGSRNETQQF